jgi:hypothetical protein
MIFSFPDLAKVAPDGFMCSNAPSIPQRKMERSPRLTDIEVNFRMKN